MHETRLVQTLKLANFLQNFIYHQNSKKYRIILRLTDQK